MIVYCSLNGKLLPSNDDLCRGIYYNVLQCKEWIFSRLFCSLMGSSLGDDSSAVAVGVGNSKFKLRRVGTYVGKLRYSYISTKIRR